jgi:hypothetical protein
MSETLLQRLRKSYALADLPDTITTGATGTKPIDQATVDDIAFAVQALNDEMDAVYRRSSALRSLHDKARRVGALGSTLAVVAAANTLDGGR